MAAKALPSQTTLRQLLDYDPDKGELRWRLRGPEWFSGANLSREHAAAIWNRRFAGQLAFQTPNNNGYVYGSWFKTNYLAHRIIWKWWHNTEPPMVDHINGNKRDNRIVNLRAADASLNARNMPLPRNNTSGEINVHRCTHTGRYRVCIMEGSKTHRIGRFDTIEEAVAARNAVWEKLGFHRNHGRRN